MSFESDEADWGGLEILLQNLFFFFGQVYLYHLITISKTCHSVFHSLYVVFLGQRPEEALHQQFLEVLQEGTPANVPPETLLQLLERRAQETQKGPWVEHHYAVKIKRKEKKGKKPRGKRKKR